MKSLSACVLLLLLLETVHGRSQRLPVSLLIPDPTNVKLMIDPRGIGVLRKIGDYPVAVVTAIGRARSGKSFSLNYLLNASHESGFEVGDTDRPKTVGATVWPRPIGDCGNFTYVVIDTEGIGAGIQTYDKALLLVALVLSSRIIYHNSEWIWTDDVTRLYGLACLAENYDKKGWLSTVEQRGKLVPPMSWVVQRYTYKRNEETEHTENDVLFNIWLGEKSNPSDDPAISRFNSTVRLVKTLFPRHSVHLVPMATSVNILPDGSVTPLTDVPKDRLSSGYISAMKRLQDETFGCDTTVPRSGSGSNNKYLTGNDIADLLISIIEAANKGVDYVGEKVNDILAHNVLSECVSHATEEMDRISLPVDSEHLVLQLENITCAEKVRLIGEMPMSHTDSNAALYFSTPYVNEMNKQLKLVRDKINDRNIASSNTYCRDLVTQLSAKFDTEKAIREFDGNLTKFNQAYATALITYDHTSRGPAASRYRDELVTKGTTVRIAVSTQGMPSRRLTWFIYSLVIVVVTHMLSVIILLIMGDSHNGIVLRVVSLVKLGAFSVLIISGWSISGVSILGTAPIKFDPMADTMTQFYIIITGLLAIIIAHIYVILMLALVTLVTLWLINRRIRQKRSLQVVSLAASEHLDDEQFSQPPKIPREGDETF